MKIRHKILMSLLCVLSMLVLVAGVAYRSTLNVNFFRERTLNLQAQLLALTSLRGQVRNQVLETFEVCFVLGVKGHEADLTKARTQVQVKFGELEALAGSMKSSVISELRSEYSAVDSGLIQTVQFSSHGKTKEAKTAILDAHDKKFDKGFVKKITEYIDAQKAEVKDSSAHLAQSLKWLQDILVVLAAASSVLAILLAFYISQSIGNRLALLEAATKRVSEGNFQVALQENGSDELSELARAFNSMGGSLTDAQVKLGQQQRLLISSSKMSSLGEMAGGIAHEINNPLAVIKSISGQVQELLGDEPLDKTQIKLMMSNIEKTTDRIAKIVMGLRTFSRDASKDSFHIVNVHKLIDETMSFCSERLRAAGVKLNVESFHKDLSFEGRATDISQVLLNLLNNANDAIASQNDKWIKISTIDEADWIELIVTDSGSGISPEIQDKIFQPFFTTKEISSGTGMGLSISIGIIQSHSGELKLDHKCPNTSFKIRLPKKANASGRRSAA